MRSNALRLATILAALVLAGCALKQPFQRPAAPAPVAYRDADPAAQAAVAPDWWRSFGATPLDTMMGRAMSANLDLAAAVARIQQADAQVKIAGAPLLPTVSAGGSANRTKSGLAKSVKNDFSTSFTASYELDFWGLNAANVEAAKASAQAARYDRQVVALTAEASVASTYFDMLGTQDRLRAAQESLRDAEDLLSVFRDRLRLGTATDLDVAQQESEVAIARAAIPPFEQQARQDANALAILLGRLPEEVPVETGTLNILAFPAVAPGLPSSLLERRPDVREAEANLIAANANILAARAAFFPTISLTGQGGFESAMLSTLLHPASELASIGLSVLQPIFSGGQLEGQLELNRARYRELAETYRKTVLTAFQDVEDQLIAVRKTTEEEAAQRHAVETAMRAYQLAREQLEGGVTDITTVLNTQKALFQSQDSYAQARLARVQALVGLFKALGGGWSGQV